MVGLLEQVLPRAQRVMAAFEEGGPADLPGARELALLATCNRVELYAACAPEAVSQVTFRLRGQLCADEPALQLYEYRGREAVRHLCRVAAGLDSMVLGEPEIAGQVARAFEMIAHRNGGPPVLASVARTARIAGRRARGETAINRKPASISSVAVHLLGERLGGLEGKRVLVVGAGRMGTIACEVLRSAGAYVTIANRTAERAAALAARIGGATGEFSELAQLLAQSDGAILATAASTPIIDQAMLDRIVRTPAGAAPVVLVDLGVPRNVAPDVQPGSDIVILDLDALRTRVQAHLDERREEIPRVEAIIDEELAAYERGDNAMLPLIGELHRHAEQVRQRELQRALRGMPPLDPAMYERIEHLTHALVNQLLHSPSIRLRAAAGTPQSEAYARTVRELWDLHDGVDTSP